MKGVKEGRKRSDEGERSKVKGLKEGRKKGKKKREKVTFGFPAAALPAFGNHTELASPDSCFWVVVNDARGGGGGARQRKNQTA